MSNSNIVLTVQREHGVKDLALHLPCALRGTAHPQPLVETHGRDDGITSIWWLLPLGQGSGGDDSDPSTQRQKITQQLETWIGHPSLVLSLCFLSGFFSPCLIRNGFSFFTGGLWCQARSLSSLCGHTCDLFHCSLNYLVPVSIPFCLFALTGICRTLLFFLVSNSVLLFLSTSWVGFFPSAGTANWCLSPVSCLIPWSLWGSVKSERKSFWWSAVQFIKHYRWAAPTSAWLLPILTLSLSLSASHLLSPHYNISICSRAWVAQWGVAGKKKRVKKKRACEHNRLTMKGWGKGLACDWRSQRYRNAHMGGKRDWLRTVSNREKEKAKDVAEEGKHHWSHNEAKLLQTGNCPWK